MRAQALFTTGDASGRGYGRTRTPPTYGAGYADYTLASQLAGGDAPTLNLFTGANDGRLVGAVASDGLTTGKVATAFNGSITSNVLTVTGAVSGDPLQVGMTIENLWGASTIPAGVTILSLGTGTGGAGTYNLSTCPNVTATNMRAFERYFEIPGFSLSIFNVASALTLVAIYKATGAASLIADDNSGGTMGVVVPDGLQVRAFGRDPSNAVITSTTATTTFRTSGSVWSMAVARFSSTQAQALIQRGGYGRVASSAATRTATTMGRSTQKLRVGFPYAGGISTVARLSAYSKSLSDAEVDDKWTFEQNLLKRVGLHV